MPQVTSTPSLSISLKFNKRSYKALENQILTFSMKNNSGESVSVLKWYTPFDGIQSNMFRIKYAGKQVAYLGRVYKRAVPTKDDYIILQPNETITQMVNLFEFYDITEAAHYTVNYMFDRLYAGIGKPRSLAKKYMYSAKPHDFQIYANKASFTLVDGNKPRRLMGIDVEPKKTTHKTKKELAFENCSPTQQSTISGAMMQATRIATESKNGLTNTPGTDRPIAPRYKEWFGEYISSRYSNVLQHFVAIGDALINKNITFNYDSSESAYAYVYPSKPYKIYLGNAFWNAPLAGTDSQAGVIVHEMSHFNVVAGTDDHVYGTQGCRDLAQHEPNNAVDNADSHEYFAENTPQLFMEFPKPIIAAWLPVSLL